MKNIIAKAKESLQKGDIKSIARNSGFSYQTIYRVLGGETSKNQTEIIKAIADFLEERKNETQRLEALLTN